jgi:hypothetical protein
LHRNCLLKHITEEKIEEGTEVTQRQGRMRKQLLDDFQERRGYWKLKEEAPDHTLEGRKKKYIYIYIYIYTYTYADCRVV